MRHYRHRDAANVVVLRERVLASEDPENGPGGLPANFGEEPTRHASVEFVDGPEVAPRKPVLTVMSPAESLRGGSHIDVIGAEEEDVPVYKLSKRFYTARDVRKNRGGLHLAIANLIESSPLISETGGTDLQKPINSVMGPMSIERALDFVQRGLVLDLLQRRVVPPLEAADAIREQGDTLNPRIGSVKGLQNAINLSSVQQTSALREVRNAIQAANAGEEAADDADDGEDEEDEGDEEEPNEFEQIEAQEAEEAEAREQERLQRQREEERRQAAAEAARLAAEREAQEAEQRAEDDHAAGVLAVVDSAFPDRPVGRAYVQTNANVILAHIGQYERETGRLFPKFTVDPDAVQALARSLRQHIRPDPVVFGATNGAGVRRYLERLGNAYVDLRARRVFLR